MKKFNSILLGLTMLSAVSAYAVPAKRGFMEIVQPDGTVVKVQRMGDEYLHFFMSEDGRLLKQNNDGYFENADFDTNGQLVASGSAVRMVKDIDFEKVNNVRRARIRRNLPAQSGLGRYTSNFPRTGDIRAIVILVQYKDVSFTLADPKTYFNDMLNKKGFSDYGGTGSAVDYFLESSSNQFRPVFDVFGPVTLPQNRSYYGANVGGEDVAPEDMVVHACNALDATVDFSKYDMDGDGYVDNVYVFYAGQGEASYGSASTVWPHSWELSEAGKLKKYDGVYVDRYACSNEWEQSRPDGIGTFVHEFSHVMGLPDLYHTSSSTATYTPCDYDVLDYGPYNNDGRTPPVYSAFERNAMGWIDPMVISEAATVSLPNLADSNTACIIPTNKPNEFFLLENRQQKGWDKYIPGHGMLIWHVDFNQSIWDNNVVNNTKSHQYVDIEEANGNPDGSSLDAMAGWTWPGTSYKTEFTDDTKPSMKTWANVAMKLPITDIDETNGIITFNVDGGICAIDTPEPQVPTERFNDAFKASWLPVENAVDYHLTVWCTKGGEEVSETANMGSNSTLSFPEGWSSSSTISYTTTGNFGEAKPSLKLDKDGAYLQTKEYDGDITKVKFWHKGQTTNKSTIDLQRYKGKEWETFKSIEPTANKAVTSEVTEIPEGTKQLRITYKKVQGNLALDDVVVTAGGEADVLLDNYNERSLGNTTSHLVTGLPEGETKFKYAVCASDGENHSRLSAMVAVDLTGASSVSTICVDSQNNTAEYYNLQGMRISTPSAGSIVICRQGNTVTKIAVK